MEIKPAIARQHTDSDSKQEPPASTTPEKGKGFVASDSVETHKQENMEFLTAIGADGLLTQDELQQAAQDQNKGRDLLDLIAAGQFVGANNEAIQKAKDKYLNDATPGGLEKVKFDLVAESQKVPAEEARNAGITTVKQLMKLKADLELLGEPDSGATLSNPEIYNRIKQKGLDGVLADAAIKNMGLPDNAKGLSLKQILNGAANAQKKGKDPSKAEYWDKIKKGQARHGADHAGGKGKPDGRVEHTPGGHDRPAAKPADNRQRGKFIEEPLHHAKPGGGHHPGDSALSPFARKKGEEPEHTNTPPQQHHDSSKSSQTKHGSERNRNWQRETDPTPKSHHTKDSTHPGGGAPAGNQSGNSTQGSDSTNAPTQGTNPRGGAANDYSSQPGSDQQTGIGISAAAGTQEAHGGAVNTVTGVHHGMDNSTTFYWTRSGGGDGQDGHYRTVYDGHGGWMVFNEDTEELVNQGVGDPPTDAISGNSTQDDDQDDDLMSFPVSGSDDDNDDDSTTTSSDTGTEGMPIDPMIGNFGDSDGVLSPWEIGVHVSRTDQQIHTTEGSSGARPIGAKKGEPNDGVTDPGNDMQSHRAGGSRKFRRSEGYTDGSPGQTGGHKPVGAGNQPKQPSHAKHQGSLHRTRRSGH